MKNILFLFCSILLATCCSKKGSVSEEISPELISSIPVNGAIDLTSGINEIKLIFNQPVKVLNISGILLNGQPVNEAKVSVNTLIIRVNLMGNTKYELSIAGGTITNLKGIPLKEDIKLSFSTKNDQVDFVKLATPNPSKEVQNLMNYLRSIYGRKTLSGTIANVAWNINEAEWVHQHTGKWPAINCFDYIHLQHSPANWIDYGNTTVVEKWWNNGGLVFAMWHWNVPDNSGKELTVKWGSEPDETRFDVKKIDDPNSDEYKRMIADIDKLSGYLKLLKDKNIPVVWRPLHEAAGNTGVYTGGTAWFWWGGGGAEPFKKLWRLMFDRMTHFHGLDNLIWVWTSQMTDPDWYPGDDYVDMVGRDIYNASGASTIKNEFITLQNRYPGKPIALSECGNVANVSAQWIAGAKWLWFMPWYDYNRTLNPGSEAFLQETHEHAPISWWEDALSQTYVITRDELPDLK